MISLISNSVEDFIGKFKHILDTNSNEWTKQCQKVFNNVLILNTVGDYIGK